MQVACEISLESSQWGLQFCFKLHLNPRSAHKVMRTQSRGSPNFKNFRTPIWESREKNAIWMWASWRGTKYSIRGKVIASPKSKLWWVLWIQVCSWFIQAPKVLQLCTNHLVFGFVQVRVSGWCLSLFLIPSWSSNMPLYPPKVLRAKKRASILCSSVVFNLDSHLNPLRSLGTHQIVWVIHYFEPLQMVLMVKLKGSMCYDFDFTLVEVNKTILNILDVIFSQCFPLYFF